MSTSESKKSAEEVTRIVNKLRQKIPSWIPLAPGGIGAIPAGSLGTAAFGILGKCCTCTEQLLKQILFALVGDEIESHTQLGFEIEFNMTLGEIVRKIKAQQKDSKVFQKADKNAIGKTFGLLDRIVVLRNKLIHLKIGGDSYQNEADIHALLNAAYELSNSWLVEEVLGQPRAGKVWLATNGLKYPIGPKKIVIGRGIDCDLCLKDEDISRHHCSIHWERDEGVLIDLNSSNGTYLNGKRVHGQFPFSIGDEICIANVFYLMVEFN